MLLLLSIYLLLHTVYAYTYVQTLQMWIHSQREKKLSPLYCNIRNNVDVIVSLEIARSYAQAHDPNSNSTLKPCTIPNPLPSMAIVIIVYAHHGFGKCSTLVFDLVRVTLYSDDDVRTIV